ncbi:MAG: hypothetical protein R6U50_18405 [Desulfobacterales bacterium]
MRGQLTSIFFTLLALTLFAAMPAFGQDGTDSRADRQERGDGDYDPDFWEDRYGVRQPPYDTEDRRGRAYYGVDEEDQEDYWEDEQGRGDGDYDPDFWEDRHGVRQPPYDRNND